MKTNNKTTKAIRPRGASLLAAAMGAVLLLNGCAGGGNAGGGSTASWPSATPPATAQTNTYVGTQSPGLYTVTIDHTGNTFSYQDLSTSSAAVSGTFTASANGFLALSTGGYALEQLSRAVLLVPPLQTTNGGDTVLFTSAPIFAIVAPACQVIPDKTEFNYLATANPNYILASTNGNQATDTERAINSGLVYASTDATGANWVFGGEIQYELGTNADGIPLSYSPVPDPFSATCAAANTGPSLVQTTLTEPTSTAANFIVGPTGYFIEDRYQSDGVTFVGAFTPTSPIDLSQLSGATFVGVEAIGGAGTSQDEPTIQAPQLVSFSAATDSSGTSIELTGGAFPNSDPTQTPAANLTVDLGAQDSANNGYFPSAGGGGAFALVSNAGGKYSIFMVSIGGGMETGWILFQQ